MLRVRRTGVTVLLCVCIAFAAEAQEASLRVVVFTPTTEGNTYWPQVYDILEGAAEDLGVELLLYGFDVRDRYAKSEEGAKILRSVEPIDGAIFSVAFGQTLPLLEVTEELDIPVMIQGPLFASELPPIGYAPRRAFSSWVGLFREDELEKGRILGEVLIDMAVQGDMADRDGTVQVVGIGGDPSWFGSELRSAGLAAAVAEHRGAQLLQVAPTLWRQQEGYDMARRLLERYPDAAVFWAASDQLAIGATHALRDMGRSVGEDVVIGGLDLSERGLQYVRDGLMSATTASLLLGYARVLVYLTDYIRGVDFADETGTEITLPVWTATKENARQIMELYNMHREIDYRLLSRSLNRQLRSYDFSPPRLRAAIREQ